MQIGKTFLSSIAILVVVFSGSFSNACLNDQELPQREREFRSHYAVDEAQPQFSVEKEMPRYYWTYANGAFLFVGAGTFLWLSLRQSKATL